jgi:hypothetical protein
MASTTNYSWSTPDDTDLVKDGAAAIRTLGSSIDTTTKALNPSTTLGDVEYRSATANTNTRLGIGTTGQILTVAGGVPTWASPASAGSLTLLSTTTCSGTTTSITSINGTYKNLYIEVENMNAANDFEVSFRLNGSSTLHYYNKSRSNSTSFFNAQNTQLNYFDNAFDNGTNNFLSLTVFNYASTTTLKTFSYQAGWTDLGPSPYGSVGGGYFNSSSAITSFDTVANISLTAGTIRIYGVN